MNHYATIEWENSGTTLIVGESYEAVDREAVHLLKDKCGDDVAFDDTNFIAENPYPDDEADASSVAQWLTALDDATALPQYTRIEGRNIVVVAPQPCAALVAAIARLGVSMRGCAALLATVDRLAANMRDGLLLVDEARNPMTDRHGTQLTTPGFPTAEMDREAMDTLAELFLIAGHYDAAITAVAAFSSVEDGDDSHPYGAQAGTSCTQRLAFAEAHVARLGAESSKQRRREQ